MSRAFFGQILAVLLVVLAPIMATAQVEIGFGGVAYDPDQPVEVTAESLVIDQETGEAIFTGNVLMEQGNLRMAAARVRVLYEDTEDGREVREVIATGGVLVTRGSDAAEGQEAYYDVSTTMLTMVGSVLVTQGPTAVAGDRMVVNMRTGNGTVDGRVRTVIDTGDGQ